jgi:hypothetical protein
MRPAVFFIISALILSLAAPADANWLTRQAARFVRALAGTTTITAVSISGAVLTLKLDEMTLFSNQHFYAFDHHGSRVEVPPGEYRLIDNNLGAARPSVIMAHPQDGRHLEVPIEGE